MSHLKSIWANFAVEGDFLSAQPWGRGHINDSYRVLCAQPTGNRPYLLQRINHRIFHHPEQLMENIERVTTHCRLKLQQQGITDWSRRILTPIPAADGVSFTRDPDGNYWRLYHFIDGAQTYDVPTSAEQLYQAALAFGRFQALLIDLPEPPLHETIPAFHDGPARYRAFEHALAADTCRRVRDVRPEILFLQQHADIFDILPAQVASGRIPLRITHNDTKINNVLLDDRTGEGLCVIDLDTVMPGLAAYDFGDLVRTALPTAAEDEQDLSRVTVDLARFEALLRGYLAAAGSFLNQAELDHLVLGGKMLTLIMGTRFLTDFLAGDMYYKIHHPSQNLDRTRAQFRLVQALTDCEDQLQALVSSISRS